MDSELPRGHRRECCAVNCEREQQFADLTLLPEVAEWMTGQQYSTFVTSNICEVHWKQLENSIQAKSIEEIPRLNPDLCSFIYKGYGHMFNGIPFNATKFELKKQDILKEGRKYQQIEHEDVHDVIQERGKVIRDPHIAERLTAVLVDEGDIPFGPTEEAKERVISELSSAGGISVKPTFGSRNDFVISTGEAYAVGDVVWIGENVLSGDYGRVQGKIGTQRVLNWNEDLKVTFDSSNLMSYSNDFAEKALRVLVFESLDEVGFIGVRNEMVDRGGMRKYKGIRKNATAVLYTDLVALPLIESVPDFLHGESTFEELRDARVDSVKGEVSSLKMLHKYLKSNI